MNFYTKKPQNLDHKVNQRQNTVCLQQQIYASPDNFTPTLLVMLETFRRYDHMISFQASHWSLPPYLCCFQCFFYSFLLFSLFFLLAKGNKNPISLGLLLPPINYCIFSCPEQLQKSSCWLVRWSVRDVCEKVTFRVSSE